MTTRHSPSAAACRRRPGRCCCRPSAPPLNDLEHPHGQEEDDDSGKTPGERLKDQDQKDGTDWDGQNPPWQRPRIPAEDLADALVEICAAYLRGKIVSADNADVYQVIIHAGAEAVTADPDAPESEPAAPGAPGDGVSAETRPIWHPAWPGRLHLDDGSAISPGALRLTGCNATLSTMLHAADGGVLAVGRRTRKPSAALRRALRERDGHRCTYPGCESRRTDAHHIRYWPNGGETKLRNLCSLCKRHHKLVHDKGIIIAAATDGFAFCTAAGTLVPASPPLPRPAGDITGCHSAAITPSTIIPPHSGERLDLHLAIWTCFTNAKNKAERREREQREAQTQAQAA
jgi:hypothetical protein